MRHRPFARGIATLFVIAMVLFCIDGTQCVQPATDRVAVLVDEPARSPVDVEPTTCGDSLDEDDTLRDSFADRASLCEARHVPGVSARRSHSRHNADLLPFATAPPRA